MLAVKKQINTYAEVSKIFIVVECISDKEMIWNAESDI